MSESRISIRVRYVECDPMGFLHHSCYLPYFEMGRTEALRATGISYRDMEAEGFFFVVVKLAVNYKKPARYDDPLELVTRVTRVTPVRIEHSYELFHAETKLLLSTATSTIACLDRAGDLRAMPETILAVTRSAAASHDQSTHERV
jgi:acyl-CoA thioester hydrolase